MSAFFFTESNNTYTEKTLPIENVLKTTVLNSQGIIVNAYPDFTENTYKENQVTFFKKSHLKNETYKAQQKRLLSYQKTSKLITVGLTTKQIIFPFHSFT
ncbi:hypothetical protein GCM10022291_17390 [Postechiella marina]|uniref:Uncharacterized protein n=1 Tax=Postechiella marina TaxID=943941 RepID=A0ABP8C8A5_9FLAO